MAGQFHPSTGRRPLQKKRRESNADVVSSDERDEKEQGQGAVKSAKKNAGSKSAGGEGKQSIGSPVEGASRKRKNEDKGVKSFPKFQAQCVFLLLLFSATT